MSLNKNKLSSLVLASTMMMSAMGTPVIAEEPTETPVETPVVEVTTPEETTPAPAPAEVTPAETEETPVVTDEPAPVAEPEPEVVPEVKDPVNVNFTLEAEVFDYGESITTVRIATGAVEEGSITADTFTIKASAVCAPANNRVAYTDVERIITDVTPTENGVEIGLQCSFGGAGESTLSYISSLNQTNTVTYTITQNEEFTLADGTTVKPGEMNFNQRGQWTNPEVDAYETHSIDGLNYRLYVPENANDGNAHPLILWLHGAGETGANTNPNNSSQIRANRGALGFSTPENQAKFGGAFVLAPQCPYRASWNAATLEKVVAAIARTSAEYNVDADRIHVSGCSMGGGGTVRIATTYPELFNCVVPICPAVGREATDEVILNTMTKQNVFNIHSANDPTVNVSSSRRLDNLLEDNEYAEYETVNYDGVEYNGHWSWIYLGQNDAKAADGTPVIDWMAKQEKKAFETTASTFTLGAEVYDYGESINTVTIDLAGIEVDPATVTTDTFKVVSSGYCPAVDQVAYSDVVRTVTAAEVVDGTVVLTLACEFGGAGEGTLLYAGGVNHSVDVSYKVNQVAPMYGTDGSKIYKETLKLTQDGTFTDPEVDAFESHSIDGLDYRLYIPENAEDGEDHALIVWLHGAGETGAAVNPNNSSQIRANRGALGFTTPENQETLGGAFVLAPQAPANGRWNVENLSKVIKAIKLLCAEYNVDEDKISVSGCSMGGGGTVRIATTWPDIWNCVVPICPAVGREATDEVILDTMTKQNVFLIHAANDPTVNVSSSRRIDGLLEDNEYAEYETVNYGGVEYPGHWSWIYMAQNDPQAADGTPFMTWLAQQDKKGFDTVDSTFALGAEVYDYGESINTVTIDLAGVEVDPASVTTDTFKVVSSGYCPAVDQVAYSDVVRTVTAAEVVDGTVVLTLACEFGGAGEGTLLYAGGVNHSVDVSYKVNQVLPMTAADGSKIYKETLKLTQDGTFTDPEVDAFESHSIDGLSYRLYVPENAEDGEEHALIVWLHGAGETGAAVNPNNSSQIRANRGALGFTTPENQETLGGAFVLAPQAPANGRWNVENLSKVIKAVKLICAEYNIDEDKISVSGCSMGGGGTVRIATTWPEIWNAVVPICPAVGREATDDIIKSTMGKQNVFLIHAANDPTVNVSSSRRIDDLLKYNEYAEYETVNYGGVEYPGHWSWIYMAQNDPQAADGTPFMTWLANQTRIGDIEENAPGATVYADEESPSGYTVAFVFDATESEKEVVKVEVSGPFNYTDKWNEVNEDGTSATSANTDPYGYVNGMYPSNAHGDGSGLWGYTAELEDRDADGIWEVTFPITSGSYGYTYTVYYADGTSEKMEDPANPANADGKMNPEGNKLSGDTHSSVVKGHWDPEKQSKSPNMDYVLPVEDEAAKGSIAYVEYTTLAGTKSHYGVYLPAGYDANREEPYKTIYISHGGGGDETDWFHMGSADDTMDNLVAAGETEAAVIIAIDNTFVGWDIENMLQVVVPLVEETYNVSKDVKDRALMGLSMGGMFTGNMYLAHPDAFGYFYMMSGAQTPVEWNDDFANPIVTVSVGTCDFASRREGNNGTIAGESLGDWAAANIPERYVGDYMYIPGSHDWFVWPQCFATWLRNVAWTDEAPEVIEPTDPTDPVTPEVKPEDKPSKPETKPETKPGTGVNTGDTFNGGIFGGMMAACAALAAAAWFALKRKN